jgi:hypothetical protein
MTTLTWTRQMRQAAAARLIHLQLIAYVLLSPRKAKTSRAVKVFILQTAAPRRRPAAARARRLACVMPPSAEQTRAQAMPAIARRPPAVRELL